MGRSRVLECIRHEVYAVEFPDLRLDLFGRERWSSCSPEFRFRIRTFQELYRRALERPCASVDGSRRTPAHDAVVRDDMVRDFGESFMLQLDPAALASILAHAAKVRPQTACGLLVGRGGLARREALVAEPAAALPADRARGRFDLHPGDWQRIDRAARGRGQDVVGVYCAGGDAKLALEATDTATAFEGYSYLVLDTSGATPRPFCFELTIHGTEVEPFEVAPVASSVATRPPLMAPMPQIDVKDLGGHQIH